MITRFISIGRLVIFSDKKTEVLQDIENGLLSYSLEKPCVVTYCPDLKKYLIQDGNHRAIQKAQKGEKGILCQINEFTPKYYPQRQVENIF